MTSARANPSTGSVLLGYDPNVISRGNVGEVLATHGYALGPTGTETEAGAGWADKLASAARGLGDQCARGAARTGNDKRTGLTLDRVMPMKQRLVTYYRAAAARDRRLERKSPGTNK